ncbi:MAG TPA: hypothetical protein VGQ97_05195 [Xanthobacteraceae bacterium]|nr:hypothetical protein [Xanthobacteraceae bacterium]
MIGYGLRVLGGLATVVVGMLLLIAAADRMFPAGNQALASAGTSTLIDRVNKGDRAPRSDSARIQDQKRITTVEVVGIRDAAIVFRDRDGHVLFSTDPVTNTTIVVKNVALPAVTIRETQQSAVEVRPLDRARPAVPNAQPVEGCEPAVSAVTTPSLAAIASRCLTSLRAKSNVASLN